VSTVHVEASLVIEARPEQVYAVITDYHVGHPAILPSPPFTGLEVLKGGKGAGTELIARMAMAGRKLEYHQTVSEPEPGRVVQEANVDGMLVTRFIVDPLDDGPGCRVTITTDFTPAPGLAGFFERIGNPPIMRYLYLKELRQLADYVHGKSS
jgi:polyketide cyclase/dehydrase/lipid transport protein